MHYDANKLLFKIGNFIKRKSVSSLHWKTSQLGSLQRKLLAFTDRRPIKKSARCRAVVSLSSGLSGLNFVALCWSWLLVLTSSNKLQFFTGPRWRAEAVMWTKWSGFTFITPLRANKRAEYKLDIFLKSLELLFKIPSCRPLRIFSCLRFCCVTSCASSTFFFRFN